MRSAHEIEVRLATNRASHDDLDRAIATLKRWMKRCGEPRLILLEALTIRMERRRAIQSEVNELRWVLDVGDEDCPRPAKTRRPG